MEPVLTTKNGRIFEIWELLERVCENPGGGHGPPLPPLADAHDSDLSFFVQFLSHLAMFRQKKHKYATYYAELQLHASLISR